MVILRLIRDIKLSQGLAATKIYICTKCIYNTRVFEKKILQKIISYRDKLNEKIIHAEINSNSTSMEINTKRNSPKNRYAKRTTTKKSL